VGNRCKNCSKRFDSHLIRVNFATIVRAVLGAAVVGFLFNILQGVFPLGGFYMLFLVYILGGVAGGFLFQVCGRKLGPKVATAVAAGLLLGSFSVGLVWENIEGLITGAGARPQARMQTGMPHLSQTAKGTAPPETQTESAKAEESASEDNDDVEDARRFRPPPEPISLSLIIFALGVLSPFMGWGVPLPFPFRR
jgi:hypothetical protein